MGAILKEILDWSEVWALLLPLTVLIIKKFRVSRELIPIKWYVVIALIINIIADLISKYKVTWGLTSSDFWWNNNVLYNINSILRLFLFSWFFILLKQRFMHRVKAVIPFAFTLFLFINFIFFEKFVPQGDYESFSSRLLATESAILLFYCLQYWIFSIIEERSANIQKSKGFWVIIGLTIYVSASFFIYLFYDYLTDAKRNFAVNIWDVHNVVFIWLCVFLAKQFLEDKKIKQ